MCVRTVAGEHTSSSAMNAAERPRASCSMISDSRAVMRYSAASSSARAAKRSSPVTTITRFSSVDGRRRVRYSSSMESPYTAAMVTIQYKPSASLPDASPSQ